MEASLELLAKFVPQQLQQGHTVKIPGLGTFRLTFKSDGDRSVADVVLQYAAVLERKAAEHALPQFSPNNSSRDTR